MEAPQLPINHLQKSLQITRRAEDQLIYEEGKWHAAARSTKKCHGCNLSATKLRIGIHSGFNEDIVRFAHDNYAVTLSR